MNNNDFNMGNDSYAGNMQSFDEQQMDNGDGYNDSDVVYDNNGNKFNEFLQNNMKIVIIVVIFILILIIFLCLKGCSSKSKLSSVTIDAPDVIYIGEETKFETKSDGGSNVKFDFSLSDSNLATLKDTSLTGETVTNYITGSTSGEVAINVSATSGKNNISQYKNVYICEKLSADKIILKTLTLRENQEFFLKDNLNLGVTGCYNNISYSSSDSSILSISDNGIARAEKTGTATITVSSGSNSATFVINVLEANKTISATGISVSKSSITLYVNGKTTVAADVKPSNASIRTVTWKSTDESVVTVSGGTITAKKVGNAVVYAQTVDGNYKADVNVSVVNKSNTSSSTNNKTNTSTNKNDKTSVVKDTLKVNLNRSTSAYTNTYIYITGDITDSTYDLSGYQISKVDKNPSSYVSITKVKTYNIPASNISKVTENGTYYVFAKNKKGTIAKGSITINNIDKKGPTFSLSKSSSETSSNPVYITGTLTDNESGIQSYALSTTNSTPTTWVNVSNGSKTYTLPQNDTLKVSSNGTYYVFGKDQAGNVSSQSITIDNIDKSGPTITLTSSTSEYTSNPIYITGSITDNTGIQSYAFSTTDTTPTTWNDVTGKPKSFKIQQNDKFKVEDNGTFYVFAKDINGYISKKSIKIANYVSTKPSCKLTVSSSGVTLTKENYEGGYGLSTSSTPDYNSKTTLALSSNTFYGYVKNKSGLTASCSVQVFATTSNTTYSCPSGYAEGSSKCYKSSKALYSSGSYCPSGYTKCQSGYNCQCYQTVQKATAKYYYTCATRKCLRTPNYVYKNKSYVNICGYKTTAASCKNVGCTWTRTRTCTGTVKSYYCPTGYTSYGSTCLRQDGYNYYLGTTTYSYNVSSNYSNVFTCNEYHYGDLYYTCSYAGTNYECPNGTTVYGSYCYKYDNLITSPGYYCTSGTLDNGYCYTYEDKTSNTTYSCSSGTKVNDSYCYK